MKEKKYIQRFRTAWQEDERFKDWLQRVPYDDTKARCRACGIIITAHMKSLIGHHVGKHHNIKLKRYLMLRPEIIRNIKIEEYRKDHLKSEGKEYDTNSREDKDDETESHGLQICHETPTRHPRFGKMVFNPRKVRLSSSSFRPEDDLDMFGKSIVAQMRTLPPEYFISLTSEIQNLVSQKRLKALTEKNSHVGNNDSTQIITVSVGSSIPEVEETNHHISDVHTENN
ncbi:UNVERIFIED_CONTAM: hypothetical protein RMT77_007810 [Armadillidium vulgare]